MIATIPTTRRRIPLWVLALGLLLIAIPAMNAHAVNRHGRTAWSAHRYVNRHDPGDCKPPGDDDIYWTCTQADGRVTHILRLDKLPGCPVTWAIVIVGGCGTFLVTCWLSQSRRSVEKMKDRCR